MEPITPTELRALFPEYGDWTDAELLRNIQAMTPDQMRVVEERRAAVPGFTPIAVPQGATTYAGPLQNGVRPRIVQQMQVGMDLGRTLGGTARAFGQGVLEGVGAMLPAGSTPQADAAPPFGETPEGLIPQFARTIGNFVPGAGILGPGGSIIGRTTRYAAIPGTITEAAGQAVDAAMGEDAGAYARAIAGILATGGVAFAGHAGTSAGLPRSQAGAASILGRALRDAQVTPDEIARAEMLVREGQDMGITLTMAEALHYSTAGRVDLTALQRVVEQSRTGAPVMSRALAERPEQARAAVTEQTATMAPVVPPAELGLNLQRVSQEAIDAAYTRLNNLTRGTYRAAGPIQLSDEAFDQLLSDPLIAAGVRHVRNDPVYSRFVEGYEDNSIAMLDAVKKWLEDMPRDAVRTERTVRAQLAGDVRREAVRAADQFAADTGLPAGPYGQALDTQMRFRRDWLDPLEHGPLGQVAGTADLVSQIRAIFPVNPFLGSDEATRMAIGLIAERSPEAAQAVIRQHIEGVFNEAAQATQRGPNPFGAANFVATLQGNRQQFENLRAAFEAAFPDGAARFDGFQRLMSVLEASGRRQAPGSPTASNLAGGAQMETAGTPAGTVASLTLSPTTALGVVSDWYRNFLATRNGRGLAELLTDPNAGAAWQRLARGGPWRDMTTVAAELLLGQGPQMSGRVTADQMPPLDWPGRSLTPGATLQ